MTRIQPPLVQPHQITALFHVVDALSVAQPQASIIHRAMWSHWLTPTSK